MPKAHTTPRLDWHSARHESYLAAQPLAATSVALEQAVGRIVAQDVTALCDVPHYASSAMDGWAVSGHAPWRLVEVDSLAHGEACAIVTGGAVPAGTLGVLRSENGVVAGSGRSALLEPNASARADEPSHGEHVRPPAEEASASDVVIAQGTRVNPAHIAVAAVCGHDELPVLLVPKVSLVLTGDEVMQRGIPAPGRVRDTFGPQLPSFIRMLGGEVTASTHLRDDLDLLITAIKAQPNAHLVLTTGGTGSSAVDHLHAALHKLGATIRIDGVAMRPGGPSLLAELPDGRFLIGLPGNPLAAMMGILTLVQPLLARLSGASEPLLGSVTTAGALSATAGPSKLLPYRLEHEGAVTSQWLGSGMLRGLAEADGVLVSPASGADVGECVQMISLPWRTST